MILAIGMVVDDAIVVVECEPQSERGNCLPKGFAVKAMEGKFPGCRPAVVFGSWSCFIPSFSSGDNKTLWQFAITIVVSVFISGLWR